MALLSELKKRGYIIAVTTIRESPPEHIWRELDRFKIASFIDCVLTPIQQNLNEREKHLSRADLLMEIIQMYNANKAEVIFVGDRCRDMTAGKKVGVFTIGVLTGRRATESKLYKCGASLVISSVSDLFNVLKTNN